MGAHKLAFSSLGVNRGFLGFGNGPVLLKIKMVLVP